jgi:transcriptional regulator with XRE-family HTH domain
MAERRGKTFGQVLREARHVAGYNLKYVAERIKKEDGESISLQYLSDLEKGRRNPPSDRMIDQFVKVLKIDRDYLYLSARRLPAEVISPSDEAQAQNAMRAFKEALKVTRAA